MELREALTQISEIRLHMARTQVFRGYRSVPVAFSGMLAVATALVQAACVPEPLDHPGVYLTLWVGAAAVSALAAGLEILVRSRRSGASLTRELTWLAVEQFLPCIVAGGLLTGVLYFCAPASLWMLPGLWQILFSLGIFASYRLLPRATFGVGIFYILSGALCLAFAQDAYALSPWAMGLPFGVGQLYAAGVLYWTLERSHDDA